MLIRTGLSYKRLPNYKDDLISSIWVEIELGKGNNLKIIGPIVNGNTLA